MNDRRIYLLGQVLPAFIQSDEMRNAVLKVYKQKNITPENAMVKGALEMVDEALKQLDNE